MVGLEFIAGLFAVFGGALAQMWQTEIGGASMDDAFQFFVACAFIFMSDEPVTGADTHFRIG